MTVTPARLVAAQLLQRVDETDAYANILLPQLIAQQRLDSRDAGLAQELAFGTLRRRNTLEEICLVAANRPRSDLDEGTLRLLALGAYQLLLTRIPSHAAINESVEIAKKTGQAKASGLINAVLRKVMAKTWDEWLAELEANAKTETERLSLRYSHPEWMVSALKLALVADGRAAELERLLEADNESPLVNLVALPGRKAPSDSRLERHPSSPIGYELAEGNPANLGSVLAGDMRVQDAGSQLVALSVVAAKKVDADEQWLDLCAGPGGKAVLLAALAAQSGATLTANEPSIHRAKLVRDSLEHAGFKLKVTEADGRDVRGSFDRILIDAPCTGLGALRRRPESRWRKDPKDVKQLTQLQLELVEAAWRNLKPGGTLVYSTCSPHPAETTGVIEAALKQFSATAELLNATEIVGSVEPNLRLTPGRRTVQLWPHRDSTDAMFIAILRKSVS
jgi:16S rRNA (cytosine967-C5)-methyltransferase